MVGNLFAGITLDNAPGNRIGPRTDITDTMGNGIEIFGEGAVGNGLHGNLIRNNSDHGIYINGARDTNMTGTITEADEDNLIAGNGKAGIYVESGSGNKITYAHIFDNGGLGIDIGALGVEESDPLDADEGGNDLLNAPVLS